MSNTDWHVLLLVIAALAFLVAVLLPNTLPLNAYRLRIVAAGLLFWVLAAILVAAGVL